MAGPFWGFACRVRFRLLAGTHVSSVPVFSLNVGVTGFVGNLGPFGGVYSMTSVCPSKKELEALSKCLLALFPARCRKGESGRVRRAQAYWRG